jgi:hypothetical protein
MKFSGDTYDEARDGERLSRQAQVVLDLMRDGKWRTLADIAGRTQEPEASISARLRDLRKERNGSYRVEREYLAGGIWQYRVLPPLPSDQEELFEVAK